MAGSTACLEPRPPLSHTQHPHAPTHTNTHHHHRPGALAAGFPDPRQGSLRCAAAAPFPTPGLPTPLAASHRRHCSLSAARCLLRSPPLPPSACPPRSLSSPLDPFSQKSAWLSLLGGAGSLAKAEAQQAVATAGYKLDPPSFDALFRRHGPAACRCFAPLVLLAPQSRSLSSCSALGFLAQARCTVHLAAGRRVGGNCSLGSVAAPRRRWRAAGWLCRRQLTPAVRSPSPRLPLPAASTPIAPTRFAWRSSWH